MPGNALENPSPSPPASEAETTAEALLAENEMLKQQILAFGFLYEMTRFHAFDAIKDDACPCCGGRVRVVADKLHRDGGEAWGIEAA